jgi:signal transduction histidine kinase
MTGRLRLLHIEDSTDDAELLLLQLERAGFEVTSARVETPAAFADALDSQVWDLVLADHALPELDAPSALRILKAHGLDLPFVVLSGTMNTSAAIEVMKAGAHDFVPKDEPSRLEPIIARELREAANRRARAQAEVDRAQLIVQLEDANRSKDEFLAMLGHELRNPLAPIATALQLMKLRNEAHPSRELEIVERQVQHLMRLIDDLFDVARVTRGKVDLEIRTIEIAPAIARGIEIASPLIEQRRHTLTVDVPPQGLRVDGDEHRLAQVFSNLLTNAARYTPLGGAISLSARREGGMVAIAVKDNGIGIDAALLPRIFDAFVQGSRAIDRSAGGLGIGLALVRNLVTLHGGTVAVSSTTSTRGSELIVRIPMSTETVSLPPAPAQRAPTRQRDSGAAVLVVDDNQDAAELLATIIRMHGYHVEVAHDGPGALDRLDGFSPGAIILDIGLPDMDGYELARRIRERPQQPPAKLIALTGYGQRSDHERSREAGFELHLVKPVNTGQLLDTLDALFSSAAGALPQGVTIA